MTNLNHIFRRTHLYLGMLLIPWMCIYASSTFMLNHGPIFRQHRPGPDAWIKLWEKDCQVSLPSSQEELRTLAATLLEQHGFGRGPCGVQRNPKQAIINAPRFLKPIRMTYRIAEQKLIAEQRETSWVETFQRLHFRTGYGQGAPMQTIWGFIVDLVCVSFLVWTVTGLYLWWKIRATRAWGWLAIGAGMISFTVVLFAL